MHDDLRQSGPWSARENKPTWAQLTRLAGDRAAILFEQLRDKVSKIDGLREELHFDPGIGRWTPRYLAGQLALFSVVIAPGRLEGRLEIDPRLRDKLITSPRIGATLRTALRDAAPAGPAIALRLPLRNQSEVRAFANLALTKSRWVSARD